MSFQELTELIATYVIGLFRQYETPDLLYHNLEHTKTVVTRTNEIAAHYSLSEMEQFVLLAAAWFHDTGQLFGNTYNHEEKSVSVMWEYLKSKTVDNEIIDKVEGCICATRLPHQPKAFLEEILCDADTYNLGTEDFFKTDELLKRESELRGNHSDNWTKKTLQLLESHKYFTSYCQALLNEHKHRNIEIVRNKIAVGD